MDSGQLCRHEELKFLYGKNYGWGLKFSIKGKLLTALYPGSGYFTVQIILRSEAIEKAQGMKLGKNALQAIERANPYPEGRGYLSRSSRRTISWTFKLY